jgi:hypothetical protein
MTSRYKFIHFVETERKEKTAVFACLNNHSDFKLGEVRWYPPWRQYCFLPTGNAVFNVGCMDDIKHFIGQLKLLREAVRENAWRSDA